MNPILNEILAVSAETWNECLSRRLPKEEWVRWMPFDGIKDRFPGQIDRREFFRDKLAQWRDQRGGTLEALDFSGRNLPGVDFSNSKLRATTYARCSLRAAKFVNCTFEVGSFRDSLLYGVDFSQCSFVGTDFTNAQIYCCNFKNCVIGPDLHAARQICAVSKRTLTMRGGHVDSRHSGL